MLNRENEFTGVGYFKNLTNEIFGDHQFVTSHYKPLSYWHIHLSCTSLEPRQVENYFLALITAIKSCFSANLDARVFLKTFSTPFEFIFDLTYAMASKLNQVSENEAPDSFYYKALSEISSGFYKIIKFLIDFNKNTKCNDNVNFTGYNWVNDDSVYGVFGWGVFKFFEGLSACLKHDELMRGIAIIPWSLFTFEKQGNTPLYKRLHYHVLNKLKYNLEEFRHPLISRLIINLDGISEPRNIEPFHSPIFNDFMALLKKNYLNIFQNNPEFSRKILPKSTYYDSIDNKIVKTYPSGSESFLTVDIVFSESVVE